ncbi:MAG: signal peptidase I [Chloroflexota bacterium]|nr:signal peptidase I [Chloroflexota bacterium]
MGTTWIGALRRSVGLLWIGLLLFLVALMALPHVAPRTGHLPFIIRGGSMEPSIPLGSLVLVEPLDPADASVGDVITVRADNGVVVTHRVTRVVDSATDRRFELRGDANETVDASLVPTRALVGRVHYSAPVLGYLLFLLSLPSGGLAAMSFLAMALLAYWLLEDLEHAALSRHERAFGGAAA